MGIRKVLKMSYKTGTIGEFWLETKIGNEYRIRHHETDKKEITETKHINYLFFRMLSLIDLCLTGINEYKI